MVAVRIFIMGVKQVNLGGHFVPLEIYPCTLQTIC